MYLKEYEPFYKNGATTLLIQILIQLKKKVDSFS
jgi:hypothetical protein